jgi:hypothetical protein
MSYATGLQPVARVRLIRKRWLSRQDTEATFAFFSGVRKIEESKHF